MLFRDYEVLFCMQIRQMIEVHFKVQVWDAGRQMFYVF